MSKTLTTSVAFTDPQGNVLANGVIIFQLNMGAKLITNGEVVNVLKVPFTLTATGMMPGGAIIIANDELMPTGTMYVVTIFNSNGLLVRGPENWILSGTSPIDISTITSVGVPDPGLGSPVLQNPSAPQTITGQPLTLTSSVAFTANGQSTLTTPCSIGQILWVEPGGCYTTIDAAVAAVPSFSVTAATESSFTVTLTTAVAHGLLVNQGIFVNGFTGAFANYNGFWTTISPTSGTTVTYTNTSSGLGASSGGTVAPQSNIIIPTAYVGPEASTCSSLDTAGHDNGASAGYTMALTPPGIHIEDRRGTSKCNYNTSYNSGQIGARPSNISCARVDTSPTLTSSNIVGLLQVTGTLPNGQVISSLTGEADVIGNVTLPATASVQATNAQWAVRSVGGGNPLFSVTGAAGGGGIDRSFGTTNITQASGVSALDPKNIAINASNFTITAASETGVTATITTSGTCNFTTGQGVNIAGVTNAGYNGAWTVLAPGCNGTNTFTYTNTNYGLAASSGGTAAAFLATISDSYSLLASQPTTGIRNNAAAFIQGKALFIDQGGIQVLNAAGTAPGPTGVDILLFGGTNAGGTTGLTYKSPPAYQATPFRFINTQGTVSNWMIGSQVNVSGGFEITPSTAAGGTTFTTPGLRVSNNNAGGASTVQFDTGGITPRVAGSGDFGSAALPAGNLWVQNTASGSAGKITFGYDSTTGTEQHNSNNAGASSFTGAWNAVNITPVTVNANVATDQNLMSISIPAGTLNRVGRTLRIWLAGVYSTPAASTTAVVVKAKLGTLTLATWTSTALAGIQATNDQFNVSAWSTTQTAGATAAFEVHGNLDIDLGVGNTVADSNFADVNTATVSSVDSTAAQTLQITIAFTVASGSNVATQRQLILETIN